MRTYGQNKGKNKKIGKQPEYSIGYKKERGVELASGDPNGPGMYFKSTLDKCKEHEQNKISQQDMQEKYR